MISVLALVNPIFNVENYFFLVAYPKTNVNLTWTDIPVQFATRISLPELKIKHIATENCRVEGKMSKIVIF